MTEAGKDAQGHELAALYRHRFAESELAGRRRLWRVLCRGYFQRWVPREAALLDLACGYGEFLHAIEAAEKHGADLNPEAGRHLPPGARFHHAPASAIAGLADSSLDVVFCSNFLEHLPDKAACRAVFGEVRRLLRPGGRFLVLGPNVRLLPGAYWDFWDHHLPLSERSLAEGLALAGFAVERSIARFLPYSTQSRLPRADLLVRLYLACPPAWRLLGKQFFVVARKAG